MSRVRTSESSPLGVNWLPPASLPGLAGRVGLTLAPGKRAYSKSGPRWERDLSADLDRLVQRHGANVLVCLIEDHELERLAIPSLVSEAEARGLTVHRLPIPDGGVLPQLEPVARLVARIADHARAGRTVVIHCAGGLGRTGTVAGCLLVELGASAAGAIETLHSVRGPNCPETSGQEAFIGEYARSTERGDRTHP